MIAEDAMEVYQEPASSQICGLSEWQTHIQPPKRVQDSDRVQWPAPNMSAIIQSVAAAPPPPRPRAPHESSLLVAPKAVRRPGNPDHPAHQKRHTVIMPSLQPTAHQAVQQFHEMTLHALNNSLRVAERKAIKRGLIPGNDTNPSISSSSTLQRRHTAEDIQPAPRPPNSVLKSRSTDPSISAQSSSGGCNQSMADDLPLPGPSRQSFRRPTLSQYLNSADDEEDEEDDGMPSSTPTPPPKQRVPQRSVSSASSSSHSKGKGKHREFSAFSESPTNLHQVPLARRHSADPSASYASPEPQSQSPSPYPVTRRSSVQAPVVPEDPPSPVIPSPGALANQAELPNVPPPAPSPPPPAPSPPAPSLPPPQPRNQSQTPFSQRPPALPGSRLPPNVTQSPALSRPYVMPSPSQGAGVSQRPSRAPPALGMRPRVHARGAGAGVGKYQAPREHPRAIAKFTVPFKNRAGVGAGAGQGEGSRAGLRSGEPDPPRVGARESGRTARALEMEARRPEPEPEPEDARMEDVDEGPKEADSSYGDIPFDFDPQALDEAMSMYDG